MTPFILGTLLLVIPTRSSIVLGVDGLRRDIGNQNQAADGCKMIQTQRFVFAASGFTVGPHHNVHELAAILGREASGIIDAVGQFERRVVTEASASLQALRAQNAAAFNTLIQGRVLTAVFVGIDNDGVRLSERSYRSNDDTQITLDHERDLQAPFTGVPVRFFGEAATAVGNAEQRLRGATNPIEYATMALNLGVELRPDVVGPPFQIAVIGATATRWLPADSPCAREH